MKEQQLLDCIGEIDSQYVEDAMAKPSRAIRHRLRSRILAAAACLILVSAAVFTARFLPRENNPGIEAEDPAPETAAPPADVPNDSEEYLAVVTWHGKAVRLDLAYALDSATPGQFLTLYAMAEPDPQAIYQGKALQAYQDAADALTRRLYRLEELQKEGPALQYGEKVCTEGLPDGTRWAEEYFQERVAYYGELLDQYIADGTFLQEQAAADLVQCEADAQAAAELALEARVQCRRETLQALYDALKADGCAVDKTADGLSLSLTITPEAFAALELPQTASRVTFYLPTPADWSEDMPLPE